MKIIIIGAGQVGSTLAENLAREYHDITLIDLDEARLQFIQDHHDIRTVTGTGCHPDILAKHGILPKNFIMVGNSLRSDILPVTKIGGTGIFIPHQYTWIHEKVDETQSANNYIKLKSILDLKLWLRKNIKTFYQPNRKIY